VRGNVTILNGKALGPKDAFELVYRDGRPEGKLNGQALDASKLEVSVGAIAECLCNGEPLSPKDMKVPAKGPIGLQAETGRFEFRNVRIRLLQ
jgi:hypothetical protein